MMMSNLLKTLPQEIQDEISMYNFEHRPLMKKVLESMGNEYGFHKGQNSYWKIEFSFIMRHYDECSITCLECDGYKPISLINKLFCCSKCERDDSIMNFRKN